MINYTGLTDYIEQTTCYYVIKPVKMQTQCLHIYKFLYIYSVQS